MNESPKPKGTSRPKLPLACSSFSFPSLLPRNGNGRNEVKHSFNFATSWNLEQQNRESHSLIPSFFFFFFSHPIGIGATFILFLLYRYRIPLYFVLCPCHAALHSPPALNLNLHSSQYCPPAFTTVLGEITLSGHSHRLTSHTTNSASVSWKMGKRRLEDIVQPSTYIHT